MFPAAPLDRRTPRREEVAHGPVRHEEARWAVARLARADAVAAGALVFAALAGWRRISSPSVTASGSPNRLLCPDPVRYMPVINGPIEHACAYMVAGAVGSNV